MTNFLELLHYDFILRAVIAGLFVAAACGILGVFLVLRHLSLISDGLSHIGFGAIAFSLFLGIYPFYISLPLVIMASLLIIKLHQRGINSGDAAIGMIASLGIAVGVIFASLNHGVNINILGYLFGNILTITASEMWFSVLFSCIVMLVVVYYYWDLFATTFDNEYAEAAGINTRFINNLLMILTAIVVVVSIRLVGAMLVSALMIFPASTALRLTNKFRTTILVAWLVASLSVITGMILSVIFNLPTGALIVVTNGVFFLAAIIVKKRG